MKEDIQSKFSFKAVWVFINLKIFSSLGEDKENCAVSSTLESKGEKSVEQGHDP